MPYKICTYCGKTSYSAADSPSIKWLCPYCNKDISHVKGIIALPKDTGDQNSSKEE
ncbi:MAG: hypothetical protein GX357_02465 [Firmicutes bacterium]|nr:hypothetical protein [Bacillota bacterium]